QQISRSNGPVYLDGVDRNERQADQSREHHVHQQCDELLDIASYPLQLPQSFATALILKQRVREIQRMSNAIGVDACANLLRDYIDEIILEILGDARDQSHDNRRSEQQSYTLNELRARMLAIASRVGVDDVPENERMQQRKHLIDGLKDNSYDRHIP